MYSFIHPFTGICCGPTGSGKTELMKNIILNCSQVIKNAPTNIIWYYSQFQPELENDLNGKVKFKQCLPEINDFERDEPTLIIVDDFMAECNANIADMFTKGSHHKNVSIYFLIQNFFHNNKYMRTITRNSQYIIMFKNPRDINQIKYLSNQMYGKSSKLLQEAFTDATQRPYGYLLIDLRQTTPEYFRLRTNILPGEDMTVYVDKKSFNHDEMEINDL